MTQTFPVVGLSGEKLELYWYPWPSVEMVMLGARYGGGENYFCLQYILFAVVVVIYNLSIKYLYIYVVTDYVK